MESTNTPAIKAVADTERDLWNKWATAATSDGLITIADMHGSLSGWLARAALATPAIQAVAPTGDHLRAIMRDARNMSGPSDSTSPQEYVLAGWRAAIAAVPAQQPVSQIDYDLLKLTLEQTRERLRQSDQAIAERDATALRVATLAGEFARAAAPVAPDLASLKKYSRDKHDYGYQNLGSEDFYTVADVERLLSHSAQAPVEPVSALTDEQILQALSEITHEVPKRLPPGWLKFARAIESKLLAASPKVEPRPAANGEKGGAA